MSRTVTQLINLRDICDKFIMINGSHLRHLNTGMCVRGNSDSSLRLTLTVDCTDAFTRWEQTSSYRLIHKQSGKFLITQGYQQAPSDNFIVHLHDAHINKPSTIFRMYDEGKKPQGKLVALSELGPISRSLPRQYSS